MAGFFNQGFAQADAPTGLLGQKPPERPRGLLGRMMNSDHPIRDLFMGSDWVAQQRQIPMDDMRLQMMQAQMNQANAAQKTQAQAQAAAQQYIMSLPADQQARARQMYAMDPDSFIQQIFGGGSQFQARPGMTNAIRVNPQTGQVEVGGRLPLAPRAPLIQYGAGVPEDDGYDYPAGP